MKVPVDWLADYIDVKSVGVERLAEVLTMAGLEVEEIDDSPIGAVFSTKVTPNRGDWMSIRGVAREAEAAFAAHGGIAKAAGGRLAPFLTAAGSSDRVGDGDGPDANCRRAGQPDGLGASVRIDVTDWCARYAGVILEISGPSESPEWMRQRLLAAGMRPINAVVDVTNYVMIELGQPLHAFDLDMLAGPEIVVRAARPGETIVTLDGKERALNSSIMVIADRDRPCAIAGIMGGQDSEVTEKTRRILLESAHFGATVVRAGAKQLGMSTDASYRFERYVDPNGVAIASDAAAALIAELTGGRIVPEIADVYPAPVKPVAIPYREERSVRILGIPVEAVRSSYPALLTLGFAWDGETRCVVAPTHRPDVVKEIDVIEEIGRMVGYDKLPETLPPARSAHGGSESPSGKLTQRFRQALVGQGLTEIYTHTLSPESAFDDPKGAGRRVRPRLALSAELSGLRQSLIPNLLEALGRNARLRNTDIAIFEVGKVFDMPAAGTYGENLRAAAAIQGDYAAIKGVVENLFALLRAPLPRFEPGVARGMHPNRCAALFAGDRRVGFVAEVDPDLTQTELDVPSGFGRVACFELDVDAIAACIPSAPRYSALPRFPEVTRDLAMLFDTDVAYGRIEHVARQAAGPHVEDVKLLSIYAGERVEPGKKSVAVRFTLRASDRTLTDSDADSAVASAQSALSGELGARTR